MKYKYFEQCVNACKDCATACNYCTIACTKEDDQGMFVKCIRLTMECAIFCEATAKIMSLQGELAEQICQLCGEICGRCAEECEKHKHMDHCKECAEHCRRCASLYMTLC